VLRGASAALRRLAGRAQALRPLPDLPTLAAAHAAMTTDAGRAALARLDEAVSDDLDTPRALADLNATRRTDDLPDADYAALLAAADTVFGLSLATLLPGDLDGRADASTVDEALQDLLTRREEARARRDWPESDRIRAAIAEAGWRVVDTEDGPVLEPVRADA